MALLWEYTDQMQIKPISGNFPKVQFEQIGAEVQVEDLQKILGFSFYQDLIQNPSTTANAALLDGGTYTSGGVTYTYAGLKYVLAYLFYARYVKVSFKKDTAGGLVQKNFEESRQINEGANSNYHKDFRKIAFSYWKETECFLRANSSDYPYYCTDPSEDCCWSSDAYRNSWCF